VPGPSLYFSGGGQLPSAKPRRCKICKICKSLLIDCISLCGTVVDLCHLKYVPHKLIQSIKRLLQILLLQILWYLFLDLILDFKKQLFHSQLGPVTSKICPVSASTDRFH